MGEGGRKESVEVQGVGETGVERVWLVAARKVGNGIDHSTLTLWVLFARCGPAETVPILILETQSGRDTPFRGYLAHKKMSATSEPVIGPWA